MKKHKTTNTPAVSVLKHGEVTDTLKKARKSKPADFSAWRGNPNKKKPPTFIGERRG